MSTEAPPKAAPVLGNLIRQARIDAGLTQAGLSALLNGVQQSTVSMWESGKQRPKITQLAPLANALRIDRDALLAAVDAETAF